jgi:hypothetical protein
MGEYFRFINVTRQRISGNSLPFNFNLPWAKNLHKCSPEEIRDTFEYVIKGNHWKKADAILAIGDYGTIVYKPCFHLDDAKETTDAKCDAPDCDSVEIMEIQGKCSDKQIIFYPSGKQCEGNIPGFNMGEGDSLKLKICRVCGKVQGKFPLKHFSDNK